MGIIGAAVATAAVGVLVLAVARPSWHTHNLVGHPLMALAILAEDLLRPVSARGARVAGRAAVWLHSVTMPPEERS